MEATPHHAKPPLSIHQKLKLMEENPDPRVFKTHCTYEQLAPVLEPFGFSNKVILTIRDPRDVCVSLYHHLNNMRDDVKSDMCVEDFNEHFESWFQRGFWYASLHSCACLLFLVVHLSFSNA